MYILSKMQKETFFGNSLLGTQNGSFFFKLKTIVFSVKLKVIIFSLKLKVVVFPLKLRVIVFSFNSE